MNPSILERMLAGAIHGAETGHVLCHYQYLLSMRGFEVCKEQPSIGVYSALYLASSYNQKSRTPNDCMHTCSRSVPGVRVRKLVG